MKRFLIILTLLSTTQAWGALSMRRCMLLPIKDSVGGALGFRVFEKVESYLKQSTWCYYNSNSEILNILGNYKKNLDSHLQNKEVLSVLAKKTRSGSLIRISVISDVKGALVQMEIIAENGDDLYFKDEAKLERQDPDIITQTIINWFDVYEKRIPYDGRIIGVLGNQFTVDVGRASGVFQGNEIAIIRPMGHKKHPLLNEIVSWDTEPIGQARTFHVAEFQSQGKVDKYFTKKRLQLEDWVKINKQAPAKIQGKDQFEKPDDDYDFGKLGKLSLFLNLGKASATNNTTSATKKLGGLLVGVTLDAELWVTRKFWAGMELGQKFSTLSRKEGTLNSSSNSLNLGNFKFLAGYKWLPMGFFYGPQVDGYLGYALRKYGLDTQTSDGFTEAKFKGILVGARGSLPVMKKWRAHLELEFMISSKYEEEVTLYGEDDSSSNYRLEVGASYAYTPSINIEGGLSLASDKAKFITPVEREYKLKETNFMIGASFTF